MAVWQTAPPQQLAQRQPCTSLQQRRSPPARLEVVHHIELLKQLAQRAQELAVVVGLCARRLHVLAEPARRCQGFAPTGAAPYCFSALTCPPTPKPQPRCQAQPSMLPRQPVHPLPPRAHLAKGAANVLRAPSRARTTACTPSRHSCSQMLFSCAERSAQKSSSASGPGAAPGSLSAASGSAASTCGRGRRAQRLAWRPPLVSGWLRTAGMPIDKGRFCWAEQRGGPTPPAHLLDLPRPGGHRTLQQVQRVLAALRQLRLAHRRQRQHRLVAQLPRRHVHCTGRSRHGGVEQPSGQAELGGPQKQSTCQLAGP